MKISQRAMLYLEGRTYSKSEDLVAIIEQVDKKYPSLTAKDWIKILEMLQTNLMIGFVEEKDNLDDLLK